MFGPHDCWHRIVEHRAHAFPDAVAVDDGRPCTYRELDRRANALAHRLRVHGVEPERVVTLLMERSRDLVVRDAADDPAAAAVAMIDEVSGMRLAARRPAAALHADGRALLDETLTVPSFEPTELDVPTVVAAGERSLEHHVLGSRNLAGLLARGRYVELAGAGHTAQDRKSTRLNSSHSGETRMPSSA